MFLFVTMLLGWFQEFVPVSTGYDSLVLWLSAVKGTLACIVKCLNLWNWDMAEMNIYSQKGL